MPLWFALLILPAFAVAEKVSLKDAIDRALTRNMELHAQRLQVRQAEQDIRRVAGEFGPKFEALAGIGPITRATGNATQSTEDKGSFGRIILGKFTLTQPLFTWGRKGNYDNAARAGGTRKGGRTLGQGGGRTL
jgi:outer membrane protein TolC